MNVEDIEAPSLQILKRAFTDPQVWVDTLSSRLTQFSLSSSVDNGMDDNLKHKCRLLISKKETNINETLVVEEFLEKNALLVGGGKLKENVSKTQ